MLCDLLSRIHRAGCTTSGRDNPFAWQPGYGAFSVSKSNVPGVLNYIGNQEAHHRRATFQEEFINFLRAHEIEFDERYVWD